MEIFGRILELQILDSDSEIFKNSPVSCFLLAHACFVCYDSSITAGLENCRKWFAKIHKFNPHGMTHDCLHSLLSTLRWVGGHEVRFGWKEMHSNEGWPGLRCCQAHSLYGDQCKDEYQRRGVVYDGDRNTI